MSAPVLIIGIGNPSRGDDALGPLLIERLAKLNLPKVELLTDFQLQVEHALDLTGRDEVIFADASVESAEPFEWRALQAEHDLSHSSHALSPQAVLDACTRVGVMVPPLANLLAIRGYGFELGDAPCAAADRNLCAAVDFLVGYLRMKADRRQD